MQTQITVVLDSSGSMSKIEDDTKGGFNSFVREQQEESGSATVTLYEFNTEVELLYDAIPVAEAPKLNSDNYTPGGQTALHDALSTAIKGTDDQVATLPESDQPENVIVVTLTDGKENASETPQEQVQELVEEHREEHGWEFLFIGANQDAALTAEQMGMDGDKSLNMANSGGGAQAAYDSTSQAISNARETGQTGGYDESDRQRQRDIEDSM
jgi:Mg-chelatase subunit ChlD